MNKKSRDYLPFNTLYNRYSAIESAIDCPISRGPMADIINFLPDATLVIDLEGKVIIWNKAIEEMTGVESWDILGKGDKEYSIPFYGDKRPMAIDLVIKPDPEFERQYSHIERRQEKLIAECWVSVCYGEGNAYLWGQAAPLYDNSGNLVGVIESLRDITKQKRNETAVRNTQQHLTNMIKYMPDATFAVDIDGKIITWNRAIEEMTGVKAEDILGKGNYEYSLPLYGVRGPLIIDLVLDPSKAPNFEYAAFK
ncbi:MAG: PAS domain-containing protein, partial [Syntrophomonas sp.]